MSLTLAQGDAPRLRVSSKPGGIPAPSKLVLAVLAHVLLLAVVVWLNRTRSADLGEPTAVPMAMIFEPAPKPPVPTAPAMPAQPLPTPPPLAPAVQTAPPAPAAQPAKVAPAAPPLPVPRELPLPPPAPAMTIPTQQALPLPPPVPARAPAMRAPAPIPGPAVAEPARAPAAPAPVMARPALIPPRPVAGMATDRPPLYPALARRRGEQGKVVLRVKVGPTGAPLAVTVGKSSGFTLLDRAAADAVRDWRFVPATRSGRAVAGIAVIPIQFRLTD